MSHPIRKNIETQPSEPLENLFREFIPIINDPQEIISDDSKYAVVVGRDKDQHEKYGLNGVMYTGIVCETGTNNFGKKICIDALNPHKIFVCGKTGSGKSYTLGVMIEELAEQHIGIGTIVVDPMGVFWSMRTPKNVQSEDITLKWGLKPKSYDNIRVFVPIDQAHQYHSSIYDDVFSINPKDLSDDDWIGTFGFKKYDGAQGLLLTEVISRLQELYADYETFSIDDIIDYIEEVILPEKKYATNTVRSVSNRFSAAKHWGVFSTRGIPLGKLSVPDVITIIDVSKLGENQRGLVVGLLAKQVLNERTRIADRIQLGQDEFPTNTIPVTWLIIDEAHTLVPADRETRTAASGPLIEYAKRGRMPGCALVMATQRPSATSNEILSQVDLLISHNLSYEDDITQLKRRTPSAFPPLLSEKGFISSLPVGAAIISDQHAKRSFVGRIRPRVSEHGGSAILPNIEPTDITILPNTSTSDNEPNQTQKPWRTDQDRNFPSPSITPEQVHALKEPQLKIDEIAPIILPDHVRSLDLPSEIISDYLRRVLHYRISYKELGLIRSRDEIKTFDNLSSVNEYLQQYVDLGYEEIESQKIDENILLHFSAKSNTLGAITITNQEEYVIGVIMGA